MRNLLYFLMHFSRQCESSREHHDTSDGPPVRLCSVLATELRFERIIMAAIMYTEGSCKLMPSVQNVSIF